MEKRLHSLLLLSALVLSATMTMLNVVSDSELGLTKFDLNATVAELGTASGSPSFYMGCFLVRYMCELAEDARQ